MKFARNNPFSHSSFVMQERPSLALNAVFVSLVFALLSLGGASNTACAGALKIVVDKGTTARVSYFAPSGVVNVIKRDGAGIGGDGAEDGVVNINLGTEDVEKKIGTITIIKILDGDAAESFIKVDTSDFETLASLEPFDFPSFAKAGVLVSIDIADYLSVASPFSLGQLLNVTDGIVAESSALIFKDISSLPNDTELSLAVVTALPNFTGTVRVASFDRAVPINEPAMLALLCIGAFGMLGRPRRMCHLKRHVVKSRPLAEKYLSVFGKPRRLLTHHKLVFGRLIHFFRKGAFK